MLDINGALKAIGFGMLVLFFAVGVVKTCSSAADLKRPEHAFKLFIRFALAKAAVTYGLDLMLAIFQIIQGMVSTIITRSGLSGNSDAALPQEIIDKINQVGFWDSIPLWAVTLLGGLFITVLSFVMILTVYSRMFKLYMYTALAPIPMSSFAGEPTSNIGRNFLRSYAGVCLEGAVIALAYIITSKKRFVLFCHSGLFFVPIGKTPTEKALTRCVGLKVPNRLTVISAPSEKISFNLISYDGNRYL